MTNVFIIHGAYGHPKENWIPWLKSELKKLGCDVFVPKFPTPESQTLQNWTKVFEEYKEKVDEDSIFVGHSLGPAFIMSILESIGKQIKACFFVSPFISALGNPDFDEINKTFYKPYNWDKIKQNCKKFYIFHSDNDPYVSLDYAQEIANNLGVNIIIIKGAGHFNEKDGYLKFELLLGTIKKVLQS